MQIFALCFFCLLSVDYWHDKGLSIRCATKCSNQPFGARLLMRGSLDASKKCLFVGISGGCKYLLSTRAFWNAGAASFFVELERSGRFSLERSPKDCNRCISNDQGL